MSEEQQDILFDLLSKKAVYGLDESEQQQLGRFDQGTVDAEFRSFEMTTAAISMIDLASDDAMPVHLFAKISAESEKHVGDTPWPPAYADVAEETPSPSWFSWLGWGVAVAASLALVFNLYLTRQPAPQVATAPPQVEVPRVLTASEKREDLLRSTAGLTKADWAAGNVKELKDLSGDIVWSDEKQTGYMRFRGLPVNDAKKETYQLWIFDKTQDKATPIDGGTFDVASNGEVVIPVDAKLKAVEPGMFAITVEKPGGVVVSKREKIAALATVETKTNKTA